MAARLRDAVIVGGGLAGAAAACHLARAGRDVLLLEREIGPHHKICGEFLSVEAQIYLRAVGIDPAGLGAAPIDRVRLAAGRGAAAETPLPFPAAGLSRFVLDEALLRRAGESGAEIARGIRVRRIERRRECGAYRADAAGETPESATARRVVLATGKHDLRGAARSPASGEPEENGFIGFKMHYRLAPGQAEAIRTTIEIVAFDGGYAGLQPIEEGWANLCLVVRKRRFERVGRDWPSLLESIAAATPRLADRLSGASPRWERPLAIAGIPYGYVHAEGAPQDGDAGIFRLGDQFGVIPSFSGDGMSIALHSAALAARYLLRGDRDAAAFHERLRRDVGGQIRRAQRLARLAEQAPVRYALLAACRAAPGLLRWLAAQTRIPVQALEAAGVF
ncbi:MAG TPA: FAD-dependent oxidoreductase [Stellaceae bacterium]